MGETSMAVAGADLRSDDPERQARGVAAVQTLQREGDPQAAYAVATWYLNGSHGYPQSESEAAPFLQYAADHRVRDAMFDLGVLVERLGLGEGRDATPSAAI